jgi:hypothetical protein
MVVVPLFALDQYVMARRIQAIGAGVALEDGPAAPARLRSALERLLGEEAYGIAARRIALEIEQLPPPPAAVALLESLAKRSTWPTLHRSPGPPSRDRAASPPTGEIARGRLHTGPQLGMQSGQISPPPSSLRTG